MYAVHASKQQTSYGSLGQLSIGLSPKLVPNTGVCMYIYIYTYLYVLYLWNALGPYEGWTQGSRIGYLRNSVCSICVPLGLQDVLTVASPYTSFNKSAGFPGWSVRLTGFRSGRSAVESLVVLGNGGVSAQEGPLMIMRMSGPSRVH